MFLFDECNDNSISRFALTCLLLAACLRYFLNFAPDLKELLQSWDLAEMGAGKLTCVSDDLLLCK